MANLPSCLTSARCSGHDFDSWADAALYAALLVGAVMMYGETLRAELAWFIPRPCHLPDFHRGGFLEVPTLAKLSHPCRQDRMVSHHDRGHWPVHRLVALAPAHRPCIATLTNLEALAITIISPAWRADVTSIYHAWRDNKAA